MTKKRIFLITIVFLLVLTGVRLSWMAYHASPEHPHAVQGVLDLRDWNFTNNQTLTLNGEWEFFPSLLVTPGVSLSQVTAGDTPPSTEPSYIQVPGSWDHYFSAEADSGYRSGTYRLRILVNQEKVQTYGLRVPSISSSSALYIDGQLLKNNGWPAEKEGQYTAQNIPYSIYFSIDSNQIDVVIHVANSDYMKNGGITSSIKFGSASAVNNYINFSINMQLLVTVVLLLHGLFAVMLYFFVPGQKGLIYFVLLINCLVTGILLEDDKLLLLWLPINYEWSLKLLFLSYIGISACILKLITYLVDDDNIFNVFKWLPILYSSCALFLLVAPLHYLVPSLPLFLVINFFSFMLFTLLTWRAVIKGKEDTIYLFLVAMCNWANTFWGVCKTIGWIEFTMYYPVDFIVAFLGLAAFWFKRFLRATSEAEQLALELQKADKQKDEFLANVSHELRNPLHGIINIAQSVLDDNQNALPKRNKEDLSLLITVGRRMSLMLNDLLDITRLKENRVRLQVDSLRLQAVVSGVFDMLRFMTEGKQLRFVLDVPDSFPQVLADENRLVQIFFNLLHNAVKYTEAGSITVSASIEAGVALIKVADTGIGMDTETQKRIFKPYEQGNSSITEAGSGIGLGLSICKQLVELHGGTLDVSSVPTQGSVFTFTLPLASETEQEQEALSKKELIFAEMVKPKATSPAYLEVATSIVDPMDAAFVASAGYLRNRLKILAVDDDPLNLKILKNILSAEQYELTTVTSGQEALAQLDSASWDLIITDVMMPHMSGYQLAQHIRQRFSAFELPILLLTARNRPEDVEVGFLFGANDYVVKPVDALEIKARVHALTGLKQAVKERLQLEAAWLQAQIKPHFLFNTLNTIGALSDIDTTRMNTLLSELANYLRKSFDFNNSEQLVTLEHELELVRSYLFIEQARFEERVQVKWEIEGNCNFQLPPFSIQVLVENAVRHGILKRLQGGTVTISISEGRDYATVKVSDDGVGIEEQELEQLLVNSPDKIKGIGLYNTERRLQQLYGQGLQIESIFGQGTRVCFRIPLN